MKKGFTLIELLVVVLIIGILAAVAVPQYNKAVEKSKAAQSVTLLTNIYRAQQAYYLETSNYATTFDELDISIPLTGNTPWNPRYYTDVRSDKDWSFQMYKESSYAYISAVRLSGPYQGTGFYIQLYGSLSDNFLHKMLCLENQFGKYGSLKFEGTAGSYCDKLMGYTPQARTATDWGLLSLLYPL